MNIEIANRLYLYRKKNNLSQEELAEKLGISRQAVSKWERAEASPDTDNLINLAKLYGVSLDELLNSDPVSKDSPNTSTYENKNTPDTNQNPPADTGKKAKNVTIGKDGILVSGEDETVHINFKGIHVDDGEESIHIGLNGVHVNENDSPDKEYSISLGMKPKWADIPVAIIVVIAYLIMGSVWNLWHPGWIIFLTIPIINGIIDAILKRRLKEIPYPVVAAAVYLLIGFLFDLWHPGWIIFLTIPIFYALVD